MDPREAGGADALGKRFVEDAAGVVVAVDGSAGGEAVEAVAADEGEGFGGGAEVALGAFHLGADFQGDGEAADSEVAAEVGVDAAADVVGVADDVVGRIEGVVTELIGIDGLAEAMVGRRVIEEGLSVRVTEKLAQSAKASSSPTSSRPAPKTALSSKDASTVAGIEKKLTSHLGARVAVLHTPKKGRIVIEYRGNDDLQRLLEKLGVEA